MNFPNERQEHSFYIHIGVFCRKHSLHPKYLAFSPGRHRGAHMCQIHVYYYLLMNATNVHFAFQVLRPAIGSDWECCRNKNI